MTPQDTLARLPEIRARNEARTPGEWKTEAVLGRYETEVCAPATFSKGLPNMIGHFVGELDGDEKQAQRDALFCAACSRDIPALLSLVEWQQEEIEKRDELLRDKCPECDVANFLLIRTLLALIPDVVVPDDMKDYVRESALTVLSDLRDYLKHAEKL